MRLTRLQQHDDDNDCDDSYVGNLSSERVDSTAPAYHSQAARHVSLHHLCLSLCGDPTGGNCDVAGLDTCPYAGTTHGNGGLRTGLQGVGITVSNVSNIGAADG